jgi:hypothetical protein
MEKYYLGADGIKYPKYSYPHKSGTKVYCNLGSNHREPKIYDLPKSAYPFKIIYKETK